MAICFFFIYPGFMLIMYWENTTVSRIWISDLLQTLFNIDLFLLSCGSVVFLAFSFFSIYLRFTFVLVFSVLFLCSPTPPLALFVQLSQFPYSTMWTLLSRRLMSGTEHSDGLRGTIYIDIF